MRGRERGGGEKYKKGGGKGEGNTQPHEVRRKTRNLALLSMKESEKGKGGKSREKGGRKEEIRAGCSWYISFLYRSVVGKKGKGRSEGKEEERGKKNVMLF